MACADPENLLAPKFNPGYLCGEINLGKNEDIKVLRSRVYCAPQGGCAPDAPTYVRGQNAH